MFNRKFFDTKLGQAAFASVAAMVAMIAVSSQLTAVQTSPAPLAFEAAAIELA